MPCTRVQLPCLNSKVSGPAEVLEIARPRHYRTCLLMFQVTLVELTAGKESLSRSRCLPASRSPGRMFWLAVLVGAVQWGPIAVRFSAFVSRQSQNQRTGIARPHVCLRRAIAPSLEECLSCRTDLRQFAWLMLYHSMVDSVLQLCGAGTPPFCSNKNHLL